MPQRNHRRNLFHFQTIITFYENHSNQRLLAILQECFSFRTAFSATLIYFKFTVAICLYYDYFVAKLHEYIFFHGMEIKITSVIKGNIQYLSFYENLDFLVCKVCVFIKMSQNDRSIDFNGILRIESMHDFRSNFSNAKGFRWV